MLCLHSRVTTTQGEHLEATCGVKRCTGVWSFWLLWSILLWELWCSLRTRSHSPCPVCCSQADFKAARASDPFLSDQECVCSGSCPQNGSRLFSRSNTRLRSPGHAVVVWGCKKDKGSQTLVLPHERWACENPSGSYPAAGPACCVTGGQVFRGREMTLGGRRSGYRTTKRVFWMQ